MPHPIEETAINIARFSGCFFTIYLSNESIPLPFVGSKKTSCLINSSSHALMHLSVELLESHLRLVGWWLNQPIWKICSSKWESSPYSIGVKINNKWNHHLVSWNWWWSWVKSTLSLLEYLRFQSQKPSSDHEKFRDVVVLLVFWNNIIFIPSTSSAGYLSQNYTMFIDCYYRIGYSFSRSQGTLLCNTPTSILQNKQQDVSMVI